VVRKRVEMGKFPHEETRTKEKQIGENELLAGEMT
jgi:hypothetical protein